MIHIFSALVPVFSLIVLGYFFKRFSFPSHEFWPMADKLTYYVLMPALLVQKLVTAKISQDSINFVLASLLAILFTTLILIVFNKLSPTKKPSFTSIVQGGIRFNTYVFLAICESVFKNQGLVLAAIILTFAIPFINIICVSIFALYSHNDKIDFKYLLKSIITNPLIIACAVGASINFLGLDLNISITKILDILGKAALPLGLMSVGYALQLRDIKDSKKDLLVSSLAKFVILPSLLYLFGIYFELSALMINVLVLYGLLPTAVSSYILARQLGGDTSLMTSIITVQTILSAPLILVFLQIFI